MHLSGRQPPTRGVAQGIDQRVPLGTQPAA
jgi:hypothetical protein